MSGLTRRRFVEMLGVAGGSPAVYQGLLALGLLGGSARAGTLSVVPVKPGSTRVVILGAGLGGLIAAWELGKAGYDCVVLEASHRIGGRNFTVRHGELIDELGNRQVCRFDNEPHLYFNAGPARIPANHHLVLDYCRLFNIPLEVFVNHNYHAWVQDDAAFGGKPVRNQEFITDARGFIAELLAKSVTSEQLDQQFSAEDAERFIAFVRAYGDLDFDNVYRGSSRAGYAAGDITGYGVKKKVLDFSEILKSSFWRHGMHWGEFDSQAAPVMQMVGGNDRIIRVLSEQLADSITVKARVSAIMLRENAVEVEYHHRGSMRSITADYCFNSIPAHILVGIENNFPKEYIDALGQQRRGMLFKMGLQAGERFWEKDNIYGGISWTGQEIQQIWYPSSGFFAQKGIVQGAYIFHPDHAMNFTRMTHAERMQAAIRQGEKIHPGYGDYIETGVSVAWHRMNHMLGCTSRPQDRDNDHIFQRIRRPVGRHFLIGDQISYHNGWMEGAIWSAHDVINRMGEMVRESALTQSRYRSTG